MEQIDNQLDVSKLFELFDVDKKSNNLKSNNNYQHLENCMNCGGNKVQIIGGNYVCVDCFSLLHSTIDENGEWKHYNNDPYNQDVPRCNVYMNPYLPESSSNTYIKSDDSNYCNRFKQLSNWHIPHSEKSLRTRLDEIKSYCRICNLPGNVIEFAQQLYVEFTRLQPLHKKKKSSRGDCHVGIISACIDHACKEFEIIRSPEDISQQLNITTSDVTRANNLFFSVMQHSDLINITKKQFIVKPSDYILSFSNILGITDSEIIKLIMNIENKVDQFNILKKNTPQAIACGCIFFVTKMKNIKISKNDIELKCNVSVPTLTKVYEHLTEYTHKLI